MAVSSLVLAFPPGTAAQSLDYLAAKLSYYADAWDVAEDLRNGISEIVVIDTPQRLCMPPGIFPARSACHTGLWTKRARRIWIAVKFM